MIRRNSLVLNSSMALALVFIGCAKGQFSASEGPGKKLKLGQGGDESIGSPNNGTSDSMGDKADDDETDETELGPQTTTTTTTPSSQSCASQSPNTVVSSDGFLQFTNTDLKPGEFGQPSATLGMNWPNGGTNDKYGVAPATVDWRLCSKIAFVEHGHSLTRTISFKSLDADGEVTLRIHRARFLSENNGIGIWYHWAKNIEWKSAPLLHFQAQKDYDVTCSYVKSTDKWLCDQKTSAPTALDCKIYKSSECTNYALKP